MPSLPTANPQPRKPTTKKKKKKSKTAPMQRGPKGYFQGSRKEFLDSQLPEYMAVGKGSRQSFWHEFWTAWWERYPWKLEDDKEPPAEPEEMKRLASVGRGEDDLKAEVEEKLTTRLTQWFTNRASATKFKHDPLSWFPLLQQIHQLRNPRPRQRTVVQQFMADYSDEVDEAFLNKHGVDGLSSNVDRMNARYDVAKALLLQQYSHLSGELQKRAEEDYNAELSLWTLVLENVACAEDVSHARGSLFDAVHPLLQAIGTYVGCHVSLIAGSSGTGSSGTDEDAFFTAVHWWPGDRKASKNWAQWDQDGFNSGVAGPFLAYIEANDQARAANVEVPESSAQASQVSPPPQQPDTTLGDHGTQSTSVPPPILTESLANAIEFNEIPQAKSTGLGSKRKRVGKARVVDHFEDTPSDSDSSVDLGSSSGDAADEGLPTPAKRPRVSMRTTRSSTRTTTPNIAGTEESIDHGDAPSTPPQVAAATTSSNPMDPPDTPIDSTNVEALEKDPPSAESGAPSVPSTQEKPPAPSEADTPLTTSEVMNATSAESAGDGGVAQTASITDSQLATNTATPPPMFSDPINSEAVPAFLRSHGKGIRQVDIFAYLNEVQDPRFRQVLINYLNFEINDKSGLRSTLPTPNRPPEVGQWIAKARSANLPDYEKGGRTFSMLVDSIFAWWSALQPSWRSFERGTVSRRVQGSWGSLRYPRINGLLSIVVLVYWWSRILDEKEPEDGVRADYDFFADDVAWVLSNLST